MKRLMTFLAVLIAVSLTAPTWARDEAVESLRETGKAFASVGRAVSPSVVFIRVEGTRPGSAPGPMSSPFGEELPFGEEFFRRFFGDRLPGLPRGQAPQGSPRQPRMMGQGSGFVFVPDTGGLGDRTFIMTNNHVVEGADRIRVTFEDGREFDAEVTGRDPQSDVAVLELKTGGLPALPFADSAQLEVGEWVVAIGNPFGLSHTLTVGVVSATGRTGLGINDYEDFIQTDAAINPGNSGGPLVNLDGEVVGMNTAIFSRSGGYMGVGFAIPINLASAIAEQLIAQGEVTRGFLGVVIQPLTAELADSFGMQQGEGILVAQVSEDSPAQQAGLREGDVIVAYRGEPVSDVGNFRNRVALTPPGSTQEITLVREGGRQTVEITIGTLTPDAFAAAGQPQRSDELGLTMQDLTPQLAEQFGVMPGVGVLVTEVQSGSMAAAAGIEAGSLILQVNRSAVGSVGEFQQAVAAARAAGGLLLLVRKDDVQRYVVLNW
ncbi:serine protease [Thiocapsa imhoffii]|uniref:Serine protease n=1 Tax=Thiocapsa imhoffii TaxID=382777 RepID=A0A9X0WJ37_9GAMM|nr:Do family serine endopeptidase [Thiocapsa imhoffii]MBK1645661.1 serine protease [Thiocapsa imhoffii]